MSFAKVGAAVPKVERPFPKVEPAVPKVEPPFPRVEPAVPKVESPFPKVEPAIPKVELAVPKVESALPKVFSPFPNIETPLPNIESALPGRYRGRPWKRPAFTGRRAAVLPAARPLAEGWRQAPTYRPAGGTAGCHTLVLQRVARRVPRVVRDPSPPDRGPPLGRAVSCPT